MPIPLAQPALRMGITVRQARYAVKKGTLRAQKIANTWLVDEATLPAPADPRRAMEQEATTWPRCCVTEMTSPGGCGGSAA